MLPKEAPKPRHVDPEDSDLEELEQEDESERVRVLESAATFDEVIVWGHDKVPAADDPFAKGIDEWIAFAEAIHSQPAAKYVAEDATPG